MSLEFLSFWVIAIITVGSALAVVFSKDIVHSAFFLIASFFGVAGVYLLIQANFLAAVQVLVYGGAIAIILVFGVMLTQREDMSRTNLFSKLRVPTLFLSILLLGIIGLAFNRTDWLIGSNTASVSTVDKISTVMLTNYMIPFEVVAVLLLVAMVGAILLAKKA
jgi:NADH-quinone oxidoreductase subunit J